MAKKQKAEDKKNEIVEKKLLSTAPEQHHFFVADGTRIGNLPQLVGALETMHEDTYNFHANSERNDFSNWVKDIIGDNKLANDLLSSRGRDSAVKKIRSRLNSLKKKAG